MERPKILFGRLISGEKVLIYTSGFMPCLVTRSLLPSQVPLRLSISAYFLKIQAWLARLRQPGDPLPPVASIEPVAEGQKIY
ncbi:Uncharacterised protein [Legionella lansingensis]|nr:Uncharacterised protein [Legionella lansingensis]